MLKLLTRILLEIRFHHTFIIATVRNYYQIFGFKKKDFIFLIAIFFFIVRIFGEKDIVQKFELFLGAWAFFYVYLIKMIDFNKEDNLISDIWTFIVILFFFSKMQFMCASLISLNLLVNRNDHVLKNVLLLCWDEFEPGEKKTEVNKSKIDYREKKIARTLSFNGRSYIKHMGKLGYLVAGGYMVYEGYHQCEILDIAMYDELVKADAFSDDCRRTSINIKSKEYEESSIQLKLSKVRLKQIIKNTENVSYPIKKLFYSKVNNIPDYRFGEKSFWPKTFEHTHGLTWK